MFGKSAAGVATVSHQVFVHSRLPELVNLQVERGQAKRYQVRQVAGLIRRYDLSLEDE
jgi:hypothetical protein